MELRALLLALHELIRWIVSSTRRAAVGWLCIDRYALLWRMLLKRMHRAERGALFSLLCPPSDVQ